MGEMFSIANLGGPGWVKDVFHVSVEFETTQHVADDPDLFIIPPAAKQQSGTPVLDASDTAKGFIYVRAPRGHRIGYTGVKLSLQQYLVYAHPRTIDLVLHEEDLTGDGNVEGTMRVPFSLVLGAIPGLRETFSGSLFGLRHNLIVTVTRPWWTFPVVHRTAVWLQRPSSHELCAEEAAPAPQLSGGALRLRSCRSTVLATSDAAVHSASSPNARLLTVDDCGGCCTLTVDTVVLPLSGKISGQLHFDKLEGSLTAGRLQLIRLESAVSAVDETVLISQHIFGEFAGETGSTDSSDAAAVVAQLAAVNIEDQPVPMADKVKTKASPAVPVTLNLIQALLQPTFVQPVENNKECSLRYLLRLELQGEENSGKFWDTLELFLYREALGPVAHLPK